MSGWSSVIIAVLFVLIPAIPGLISGEPVGYGVREPPVDDHEPIRALDRAVVDFKPVDLEIAAVPGEVKSISIRAEELGGVNATVNSAHLQLIPLSMDDLYETIELSDLSLSIPAGSESVHILDIDIPEDAALLAARNGDDRIKVRIDLQGSDENGNGIYSQIWTELVIPMKVAILVHSDVKDIVNDKLQRYRDDVLKENEVEFFEVSKDWETPEAVREDLVSLWENDSIIGALLVGDMPFAMWEILHTDGSIEPCPIPIFYEDLDADFVDNDTDGYYNKHYWGENDGPEIWVSFIMPPSRTIPSTHLKPAGSSSPGGLRGTYFSDNYFITQILTRTDNEIEFDWEEAGPPSTVPDHSFSIIWEGQVLADHTDNYTFEIIHGGGVIFEIDGKEMVRDETNQPWNRKTTTCWMDLNKGWHDIRLSYKENGWGDYTGSIRLCWRSPKLVGDLINDWLDKDHSYHNGTMGYPEKGLLFMDYPYGKGSMMDMARDDYMMPIFGSNLDVGGGQNTTNATEYIRNHDMGHELTSIWSHAGGGAHQFQVDPETGAVTTGAPSYKLKDTKGSVVTLIWGCHAGDFADSGYWLSASKTENLVINYAFNTRFGLASAGCTRSYGTTFDHVYNDWAEGSYLGLGYFHYLDLGYDKVKRMAEPHPLGDEMWVEDEVLFGDPFIRMDHKPERPLLSIENGSRFASGSEINLSLASEGAEEMMFYSGGKYTEWVSFSEDVVLPAGSQEGSFEVYVWTRNSYGGSRYYSMDKVYLENTPPVVESFIINEGQEITKYPTVIIRTTASDDLSGVKWMSFSNDGEVWSEWEEFRPEREWNLTEGDGKKTVYAKVMDIAGNIGDIAYDSIDLDMTGPSTSIELIGDLGGGGWYRSGVTVRLSALDEDIVSTYWRIGGDIWRTYYGPVFIDDDGINEFEYYSVDGAGNTESPGKELVSIDREGSYGLSLEVIGGRGLVNTTSVELVVHAEDDLSGPGSMCFKESDDLDWGPWVNFSMNYTYTGLVQGNNYILLKVRDRAGNERSMEEPLHVLSDMKAPDLTRHFPPDGGIIEKDGWVQLEFSKDMNISESDLFLQDGGGNPVEFSIQELLPDNFRIHADWNGYSNYTVRISGEARDDIGNRIGDDFIFSFRINGTPPGAPENLRGSCDGFNVVLDWDAPKDPGDLPVEGYRIYRRNSTTPWVERGTTTNITFTDQWLLRGHDYFYRVVAYNRIEGGPSSTIVTVKTPAPYAADDDDDLDDDDEVDDDGGLRENEGDVVPLVIILIFAFIIAAVVVLSGYLLTRREKWEAIEE